MTDAHAALWGMLCPDCGPGDHEAIARAAVEALGKRCVYEVKDGERSVRYEAATAEEMAVMVAHDDRRAWSPSPDFVVGDGTATVKLRGN